jgi:uncharacterized protein YbjT (DUF2867 family)
MILVTGGTGGIGSELLRLLSHAGVGARAVARNPQKAQIGPGITWSEAMSYRQAAEIIGGVIGKTVRFVDESPDQARARRVREGLPSAVIESALAIAAYQCAGGKTVTITSTIADLTSRPPRTVSEFVREHASSFRA